MNNPYHENNSQTKPISEMLDLFGKTHAVTKKGRPLSERATLLKYFCDRAVDRKGPIVPARMGFMLAHLKVEDLYYMKSVLESEIARPWPQDAGPRPSQDERWNRIFWGMLKAR